MLFFILCISTSLALASPVNNVYSLEEGVELFETFLNEHNKQYQGIEKEERLQIFLNNLLNINLLNDKSSNAVFGITQFMDLTKEEFIQTYTGFKADKNLINRSYKAPVREKFNYTAPNEFDWRTKGVVSRVKSQGRCGSCWAFSVSGNVESINAIKTGRVVEISEQEVVDCDTKSHGCSGGYLDHAMDYFVKNGAMSLKSYPYQAKVGSCRFDSKNVVTRLSNYQRFHPTEQDIKEILFKTGPLSIVLDAHILHTYTRGIIVEGCSGRHLTHAVLLVGYGQEKGVEYWIIKNSWAKKWGESGYFRVKRGINCLNLVKYGVLTAVA